MRIHQLVLPLAMFCLLAGCGPSRPGTVPVSGRVTWQGKPIVEGRITFYPATGRPATAAIGSDGVYHLRTFQGNDGAVLGKYCVTIEAKRVSGLKLPKSVEQEMREGFASDVQEPKVEWLVPEKYSQQSTSPLTAEVTAATTIDFDLP
jgi:hypothetical protein